MELESFALFLDDDERAEKRQRQGEGRQNLDSANANLNRKSKTKGSHVFHHLNHDDIVPESESPI